MGSDAEVDGVIRSGSGPMRGKREVIPSYGLPTKGLRVNKLDISGRH
jgi:hypothetical protein